MKKIKNIEFNQNIEYTNNVVIEISGFTEISFNSLISKNIIKCHFKKSDLRKHNLDNSIFEGCVFNGCNLSKVNAKQIVFKNCVFLNCTITYSEFIDGKYINTHFEHCDLSNTLFNDGTFNFSSIKNSLVNKLSFRDCNIQSVLFQNDLSNKVSGLDGSNIFFNETIGNTRTLANNPNSYWIKERKEIFISAINYFELIEAKYSLHKEILDNEYGICSFKNSNIEFVLSQDRFTENISKTIIDLTNSNSYNYGQLMYNRNVSAKENICPLEFLNQEMALRISVMNAVYLSDKYLSDIFLGNFTNT